jgi:hypothetical protein
MKSWSVLKTSDWNTREPITRLRFTISWNAIKKEVLKNKKDNDGIFINIAPLGTKPMALGACLFALHNPEVRVVYPVPEHYEDKYSDECWNSWTYKLPLVI